MPRPLLFSERLRALAALALTAGTFCTVGWMAMQRPDDPLGAVSLAGHGRWAAALLAGLALAVVIAPIAEIVAGGRLEHFGLFAAGFGLAAVSVRGGTMKDLLLARALSGASERGDLYTTLVAEVLAWSVVIGLAAASSRAVLRWLRSEGGGGAGRGEAASRPRVDGVHRRKPGETPEATWFRDGVPALVISVAVALVLIGITAASSAVGPIQTGQVFFSVGLAFFGAAWVTTQTFPRASFGWVAAAIPAAAVVGYVWAALHSMPAGYSGVASVPSHAFARALPIEFVAVGIQGAVIGWWMSRPGVVEGAEGNP